MKRQNKLDDGLNRLFSSPKRNPADESPESNEEPVKEKKAEAKKSAPKKTADKPEPKAPPKSHLIPVPSKPTLPLQMPFSDEGDESEIVESIEEKIPAPAATKPVEKTKEKSEAFSKESTASPDIKTEESKTKVVASPAVEQKPKTKVTSTNTSTSSANIPAGETPDVSNSGKKHSSTDEQIVVFTLANQYYGVNISVVESIIKMQSITVVPRAPHYIEGVTNLRGTVVPVVSLHKRLNIPVVDESTTSRIIVVNSHGVNAGLIVDEVNSVSYISGKDIEQVAQTLTSIDSSYIRAIAKSEEKLIVLLSLENVLKERT